MTAKIAISAMKPAGNNALRSKGISEIAAQPLAKIAMVEAVRSAFVRSFEPVSAMTAASTKSKPAAWRFLKANTHPSAAPRRAAMIMIATQARHACSAGKMPIIRIRRLSGMISHRAVVTVQAATW